MSRFLKVAFALVLIVITGSEARAGFDPSLTGMSSTATTTTFTYTLTFSTASASGTNQLNSGSFVTLYDLYASPSTFNSAAIVGPPGLTVSQSLVGATPGSGTPPTDSASLENLTFLYSGTTLTTNAVFTVSFALNGLFTTQQNNYTSLTQYTSNGGGVGTSSTIGFVLTPVGQAAAVPEPGSLTLVGIAGAIGLALRARKKTAKRA